MKFSLSEVLKHPLISGSSIVFIGTFLANIFAYLFNLSMIRLLSVADYGLLTTLTSLTVLFGIFQISLIGIFAKFSAKYTTQKDTQAQSRLIRSGIKVVVCIGVSIFLILLLLTPIFSQWLKITQESLLVLIFISISLSIITALPFGILQGKMKFWFTSLLYLLSPLIKLSIGVLLVWMGYSLTGVLIAISIAALVPTIIGFFMIRDSNSVNVKLKLNSQIFFQEFKKYSLYFFLASLGISIITNADIMLVRTFFDAEVSGQYAALSLMGKAIFYFTSPIYFVFFPLIVQKNEKNEPYSQILLVGITLIALVTGAITLFYYIFPNIILSVFAPREEYKVLTPYIGQFALYITVFSVANIFNHLFLSLNKSKVYIINLLTAGFFVAMMVVFHETLQQVINILLTSASLLLVLYVLYYYRVRNEKN